MLKHFPDSKEETEFITFVERLVPTFSSAFSEDNWEAIDKTVIQIKSKAKFLGLEPCWYISTRITDLWEILVAKIQEKAKESLGIENIPEKEMLNILCSAFARYPEITMSMGLKSALDEWLGEMKRWQKNVGYFPFPTDKSSSGFIYFGK